MPRPRKPRALKLLQGTLRPHRENPEEPQPPALPLDYPPTSLVKRKAVALRKWNELISDDCWGPVLTLADVDGLEEYCLLYDQMVKLQREIHNHGHTLADEKGRSYRNPLCVVLRETREGLHRIRINFGGLPAARHRVSKVPNKKNINQPFSQFS